MSKLGFQGLLNTIWLLIAGLAVLAKKSGPSSSLVRPTVFLVRALPIFDFAMYALAMAALPVRIASSDAVRKQYNFTDSQPVCAAPPTFCGCNPIECEQCTDWTLPLVLCSKYTLDGGILARMGQIWGTFFYFLIGICGVLACIPSASSVGAGFYTSLSGPGFLSEFIKEMIGDEQINCRPAVACVYSGTMARNFPSGHTFFSAFVVACLLIHMFTRAQPHVDRLKLAIVLSFLPQGIGRGFAGVHTWEAVFAGYAFAPLVAYPVIWHWDNYLSWVLKAAGHIVDDVAPSTGSQMRAISGGTGDLNTELPKRFSDSQHA